LIGIAPFIHPALMTAVLGIGLFLLVLGLRIRKQRRQGPGPQTVRLASLHMRLGRWFTGLLIGGYILGFAGMWFSLGEPLYQTGHSYFGTLALLLFLGTAYLGRKLRLRPGRMDVRQLHAFCAFIAVFVALIVSILGFQLLP
jgi:phosphatidylglycerophosphate synthase